MYESFRISLALIIMTKIYLLLYCVSVHATCRVWVSEMHIHIITLFWQLISKVPLENPTVIFVFMLTTMRSEGSFHFCAVSFFSHFAFSLLSLCQNDKYVFGFYIWIHWEYSLSVFVKEQVNAQSRQQSTGK